MHPFVANLIEKYNIPTSNRSCYLSRIWNGKDLALFYEGFTDEGETPRLYRMEDFDILHEIAHFVVATPVEREFPEYGLETAYTHGASGRDWSLIHSEKERHLALEEAKGVLTPRENTFRELTADFLGCYWAREAGIKFPTTWWPHVKYAGKVFWAGGIAYEYNVEMTAALQWLIQEKLLPPGAVDF